MMPATTASNLPQASSNTALDLATPKIHLLAIAQAASTRELAHSTSPEIREILFDIQIGLTKQKALGAPKVRELIRSHDETLVIKLVVMVLRAAVESFQVKQAPDALTLMELAADLVAKYPCESLEDLLLALKTARLNGIQTYNSLDSSKFHRIFNDYFEDKAKFLENRHRDQKATGPGQDAAVVASIAAQPQIATMLQRRLDPGHPNHESLRRKLSITNGREERGLITQEQAAQQRAQVEEANHRHATRRQVPFS